MSTPTLPFTAAPTIDPQPTDGQVRTIGLGLQGGGSHGAFTWGVLDRLLADSRIAFDGVTGASAGAVNAVALADGFARAQADGSDPHASARASLARVWNGVVALGGVQSARIGFANRFWPYRWFSQAFSNLASPYVLNPLDLSPLRDLLARTLDFPAIAALDRPKVFVCATCVRTGEPEIFSGQRLTLKAVMASATLPMLAQAVEIDGEHYWDGGFSGNPPLKPLINACASRDVLLVQLNPLVRAQIPTSAQDIADRVNELTFNASLLGQLRTIERINQLIDAGRVDAQRYKKVLLHRIEGGEALEHYGASSKLSVDAHMIQQLFQLGRGHAAVWLEKHFDRLGKESTIGMDRELGSKLELTR